MANSSFERVPEKRIGGTLNMNRARPFLAGIPQQQLDAPTQRELKKLDNALKDIVRIQDEKFRADMIRKGIDVRQYKEAEKQFAPLVSNKLLFEAINILEGALINDVTKKGLNVINVSYVRDLAVRRANYFKPEIYKLMMGILERGFARVGNDPMTLEETIAVLRRIVAANTGTNWTEFGGREIPPPGYPPPGAYPPGYEEAMREGMRPEAYPQFYTPPPSEIDVDGDGQADIGGVDAMDFNHGLEPEQGIQGQEQLYVKDFTDFARSQGYDIRDERQLREALDRYEEMRPKRTVTEQGAIVQYPELGSIESSRSPTPFSIESGRSPTPQFSVESAEAELLSPFEREQQRVQTAERGTMPDTYLLADPPVYTTSEAQTDYVLEDLLQHLPPGQYTHLDLLRAIPPPAISSGTAQTEISGEFAVTKSEYIFTEALNAGLPMEELGSEREKWTKYRTQRFYRLLAMHNIVGRDNMELLKNNPEILFSLDHAIRNRVVEHTRRGQRVTDFGLNNMDRARKYYGIPNPVMLETYRPENFIQGLRSSSIKDMIVKTEPRLHEIMKNINKYVPQQGDKVDVMKLISDLANSVEPVHFSREKEDLENYLSFMRGKLGAPWMPPEMQFATRQEKTRQAVTATERLPTASYTPTPFERSEFVRKEMERPAPAPKPKPKPPTSFNSGGAGGLVTTDKQYRSRLGGVSGNSYTDDRSNTYFKPDITSPSFRNSGMTPNIKYRSTGYNNYGRHLDLPLGQTKLDDNQYHKVQRTFGDKPLVRPSIYDDRRDLKK